MNGGVADFLIRYRIPMKLGISALIIAGTADLFAGLLMDRMEDQLTAVIGMMILIYSAIGMRGTIFGAMGSRIGTSLNIGTFEMSFRKGTVLRANVESTLVLTLLMSVIMGFTSWVVASLLFGGTTSLWDFIFISGIGGFAAGVIVLFCNIGIAYTGYRKEWDVDNITAPLISAIGDIVTLPMIFVTTMLCFRVRDLTSDDSVMMLVATVLIAVSAFMLVHIFFRKSSRMSFEGEAKRIIVQSLPMLLFCLLFEIIAGMVIQDQQDRLIRFSIFMIMMPAFLDQGNALTGMLTSRLSSMIHLGTLEKKAVPGKGARDNFMFILTCGMLTFVYIGVVSYIVAAVFPGSDLAGVTLAQTLVIVLVAGLVSTVILSFLSYYVAILADRFGLDPDDHCIPITSSASDLICATVLTVSIALLLHLRGMAC